MCLCTFVFFFINFFITLEFTLIFYFFFSSRRRHTRWTCDWSSDVCSSDLFRGRMMPALPRESIRQLFPQQAGDDGGADRGDCQHREPNQIRQVMARRRAVVEEKQRRSRDSNGGADH